MAEGVEAKRANNEDHSVSICKPRVVPWAPQAVPDGTVFSRVAADVFLPPTLLGANRSHSLSFGEDLQRRMADEGAISCNRFGGTDY